MQMISLSDRVVEVEVYVVEDSKEGVGPKHRRSRIITQNQHVLAHKFCWMMSTIPRW